MRLPGQGVAARGRDRQEWDRSWDKAVPQSRARHKPPRAAAQFTRHSPPDELSNRPNLAGQMTEISKHLQRTALAGALLSLLAAPLAAQSVSDFRLQPGTATSAPRPVGPSDPDSPSVPSRPAPAPSASTTPAPRPSPAAAPTPRPSPRPTPVPAASATPTPEPTRAPRPTASATPAPAPEREPEAAPTPAPSAEPTRAPAPRPVTLPPLAETPSPAATLPPAPTPEAAPASSGSALWWLLAALAVAGLAAAALLVRRRAAAAEAEAFADPYDPADPASVAPTPSPPVLSRSPAQPDAAAPAPVAAGPFDIALQPVRLSVSLVNATLHYELTISNLSGQPLGPVFVAADMIGAHASIPDDSQLARDGSGLELRHEIAGLAPGETTRVKGDLRLPLSAVTPIRAGSATLLVPLVRVRAEAPGLSVTRVLVVGEPPASANGRLRPFRLDAGPRIFGTVDQRDVSAAA